MKTIPVGEAKNRFGVLMDTAQREAVAISKKGRPAAVVMPMQEYIDVARILHPAMDSEMAMKKGF